MPRLEPGNEASAWLVLSILLFYCPCSHRPLELDNVYNQDQVRHMVPYVEPSFSLMGTWIHAPMHTYGNASSKIQIFVIDCYVNMTNVLFLLGTQYLQLGLGRLID